MYRDNNSNMGGGFIFGALFGAALAYLYSQNKDTVDSKVKEMANNASDFANEKMEQARNTTSDVLQKSGKNISGMGSKLSKQIEQKANEVGEKADQASKNTRNNSK